MITEALYTLKRCDWKTPRSLYQALDLEFGFDFDPCPVDPKADGLSSEWGQCSFVNPPYGPMTGLWLRKGLEEASKGKTVVFLVDSRTDTTWWHNYAMKDTEIRFIKGRLCFDDAKGRAPFPSVILVFDPTKKNHNPIISTYTIRT